MGILNEVLAEHAHLDEDLRAAAQAFASPGGVNLGGGMMRGRGKRRGGSDGAGGASDQGGAGGGGAGGWVHLSDVGFLFTFSLFFLLLFWCPPHQVARLIFLRSLLTIIGVHRGETRQTLEG